MIKAFLLAMEQYFSRASDTMQMLAENQANQWCNENGLQCRSPAEAVIVYRRYQNSLSSGKINSIPEFRKFIDDEKRHLDTLKTAKRGLWQTVKGVSINSLGDVSDITKIFEENISNHKK